QRLLQAANLPALLSVAAVILTVFGVLLAITVLLNDNNDDTSEATPVVTNTEAADTQIATTSSSEYSTGIEVVFITADPETLEPISDVTRTKIPPTSEPVSATEDIEKTESVTIPSIHEVLQLPPTLVIEGPIETLETETLTIYGLVFTFAHDTTLIEGYSIGDTIYIEGTGNPFNSTAYLIISIEPVIDTDIDRPALTSFDNDPETSDETSTTAIFTDVGTSSTSGGETSITGTSGTTPPIVVTVMTMDNGDDDGNDDDHGDDDGDDDDVTAITR
ncbi:MAG: hypothetical protein Q9P01_13250, partial [Anaerolineae bacterium]|nr:hypothetical protein [Anaerolineae bacterium]